jgi:hypothetical protein
MAVQNTSLSSTPANIYASSGDTVVSTMYFCNYDNVARNLWLWVIPAPNTTADANALVYNSVQIASGDTFVVDMEKLVLSNGDQIKANIDANTKVTATVSYVGI